MSKLTNQFSADRSIAFLVGTNAPPVTSTFTTWIAVVFLIVFTVIALRM